MTDLVTGAEVTIARTVPVPRERMWELITAVGRIGEWSPETIGADWDGAEPALKPGARFHGHNRFPNGFQGTIVCEITEVSPLTVFAWSALDGEGEAGSLWRYQLTDGAEPGTTVVRQTFRHGPGQTGVRAPAEAEPGTLDDRLVTLCGNMLTTIAAMAEGATSRTGPR
jgi:uncharacterized protein YndB with AHSA1/START domain